MQKFLIKIVSLSTVTFVFFLSCVVTGQTLERTNWLSSLKADAVKNGIKEITFDIALSDFRPIKRVIELDRHQPEFTLTFKQYMNRVVPKKRAITGRKKYSDHKILLREIGEKYGVQPRFIVALWGVETDFGRIDGGFPVIHALATLAIDGRRSKFFRAQLLTALSILDQGHITLKNMRGSWAGAMGHFQFMPTSFQTFAVDYDGDGKRDIWNNKKDAFSSAANYLSKSGWRNDQTWGREVKIPKTLDPDLIDLKVRKTMIEWKNLGVEKVDGRELPKRNLIGSLVKFDGSSPRVFLTYKNFNTIMKWNRSTYFAVAVGTLAEKIGPQ